MTAQRDDGRTCRLCGRPLTDATSRAFRLGSECRKGLTPAQLRAALAQAQEAADPFHIPAPRPASLQARVNNHNARAATAPDAVQLCHHEAAAGACPDCRREADPHRAAERILRDVLAQPHHDRRAERITIQAARRDRGIPTPAQRPRPARRPKPKPAPAAPAQLELA